MTDKNLEALVLSEGDANSVFKELRACGDAAIRPFHPDGKANENKPLIKVNQSFFPLLGVFNAREVGHVGSIQTALEQLATIEQIGVRKHICEVMDLKLTEKEEWSKEIDAAVKEFKAAMAIVKSPEHITREQALEQVGKEPGGRMGGA